MEEKRKNIRVRANFVALFKPQYTRLARGSRIKDVSETGVCVPAKNHFPVDTLLEVVIRSEDLKEPIQILARVVRIVECHNGNYPFEVGVVFLDLPLSNKNKLKEYIRHAIALEGK